MKTGKPSLHNLTAKDYGRPKENQHEKLQELTRAHIDSFNYMVDTGLVASALAIAPVEFALPDGKRVGLFITDASVGPPVIASGNNYASTLAVYPAECRERGVTYRGKLSVQLHWTVNNKTHGPIEKVIGEVPIMVKSNACHLAKMAPAELIEHGEEAEEMGGYFIINGIEKVMRLLIMPRRNYASCLKRPSWKSRGPQYTDMGVQMRCVDKEQQSSNIVLHYLTNGTVIMSFTQRKEQFFVPVIMMLKALLDTTDRYIYEQLIRGREDDSFMKGCITNMLRQCQDEGLGTQDSVLKYIGDKFRVRLYQPEWISDTDICKTLLKQCICIHQERNVDKFDTLIFMTRKLFTFVNGECAPENPDNPMFQEVLLPGHLYMLLLRERIEIWLESLKTVILKKAKSPKQEETFTINPTTINKVTAYGYEVTRPMEALLATGNLNSRTGLGLMQNTGLSVVADKLNFYRYISHFRCVHRGAFFAQMRTTEVRKLMPEAWGFLCPVHTPDGEPCGLLNHLAANCKIVNIPYQVSNIPSLLDSFGMEKYSTDVNAKECYPVSLDGTMIGWLHDDDVQQAVEKLRILKVKGLEKVPRMLEICFVPKTPVASQYPGVFIFSGMARMMRPVRNLQLDTIEMIGSFEQVYMSICITQEEAHPGLTTHQEVSEYSMLSTIASLTPFSDFNQSPRNMYQCQMGKQTMGTPCHAITHRSDNKLYRIQTPQAPIVRPTFHDTYNMDEYPLGTNAIVAVISYTGYDMEDAMILNKSSYERGFGHGSVYKSEFIDLRELNADKSGLNTVVFGNIPGNKKTEGFLDDDGLPHVGRLLKEGDVHYSYINVSTGELKLRLYKSSEPAYVDQVKILGDDKGEAPLQKVCIVLRINRNPIIGDKFSSRHGQKGICSQKWPVENMPFSESGMTPDIIFNPHGFPSRMTIGMMIESMAGKSAASHGMVYDATPFTFSEDDSAIDHFGKQLTKAGYNYYGTERMYSGVDGREFEADIFVGVVYYQRLRHMVSDKFQVRTTGPRDPLTHQPIKGRKRGGGIRFGEMERDALLAHGTSFLLQDRLLLSSDKDTAKVCTKCGSILSPVMEKPAHDTAAASFERKRVWACSICKDSKTVETIQVPYVFRYLCAELAAMNIKVALDVEQ